MADVNQSSRSEVYQFIVDELTDCIPHLPSGKCQNMGKYYGRVTKAVGYMAMAKVAINSPILSKMIGMMVLWWVVSLKLRRM